MLASASVVIRSFPARAGAAYSSAAITFPPFFCAVPVPAQFAIVAGERIAMRLLAFNNNQHY
jgi:hypothetical protein